MKHYVLKELHYVLDHEKGTLSTVLDDCVQDGAPNPRSNLTQWEDCIWIPATLYKEFEGGDPRPYLAKLKDLVRTRASESLG